MTEPIYQRFRGPACDSRREIRNTGGCEPRFVRLRNLSQKNVRNPNHHYSNKCRNTPHICIAIHLQFVPQYFWCPYALRKGKYCQYASHLYCNTPPICIAILLGKSWTSGHRNVPHLGSDLAERIFRGFLFLSRRIFFRGFCRRILSPHFCGKSPQKNLQENPRQNSSKTYTTKIPDNFLQRGQAKKSMHHPHKINDQHRECKTGGGALPFS